MTDALEHIDEVVDEFGNSVKPGDFIVKPGRASSSLWLTVYKVEGLVRINKFSSDWVKIKAKAVGTTGYSRSGGTVVLDATNFIKVNFND